MNEERYSRKNFVRVRIRLSLINLCGDAFRSGDPVEYCSNWIGTQGYTKSNLLLMSRF